MVEHGDQPTSGVALERGMVFPQKPAKLKTARRDILENAEADLTPRTRNLIDTLWGEWKLVEQQI